MSETSKVIIAGDLFPTPVNYQLFSEGKAEEIFEKEICDLFQIADFSIANLEGCFTDENTRPKLKDGPNIRAPKECVAGIVDLGIDCVSLANNHATDYGCEGLNDTFSVLEEADIASFGAGNDEASITTNYTAVVNGRRITFYGVAETVENAPTKTKPGVNIYDEYRVCHEIRALRSECDYLVVLYHGGIENIHYNTPSIQTRFHRMADNGADIIISQHTHAIGEEEFYNGSYLLYGQGNFCFHFSKRLDEWVKTALLLEVDFTNDGFKVKKHVVNRDGSKVLYDKDQDFSDFYERCERLNRGDDFKAELQKLADEKIITYLNAFRGTNIVDKFARNLLPKERYAEYLKKHYMQKHILRILLALQSEEIREVASQGLIDMLAALEDKHGE